MNNMAFIPNIVNSEEVLLRDVYIKEEHVNRAQTETVNILPAVKIEPEEMVAVSTDCMLPNEFSVSNHTLKEENGEAILLGIKTEQDYSSPMLVDVNDIVKKEGMDNADEHGSAELNVSRKRKQSSAVLLHGDCEDPRLYQEERVDATHSEKFTGLLSLERDSTGIQEQDNLTSGTVFQSFSNSINVANSLHLSPDLKSAIRKKVKLNKSQKLYRVMKDLSVAKTVDDFKEFTCVSCKKTFRTYEKSPIKINLMNSELNKYQSQSKAMQDLKGSVKIACAEEFRCEPCRKIFTAFGKSAVEEKLDLDLCQNNSKVIGDFGEPKKLDCATELISKPCERTLNTFETAAAHEKHELQLCEDKFKVVLNYSGAKKITYAKMYRCEPCRKTFIALDNLSVQEKLEFNEWQNKSNTANGFSEPEKVDCETELISGLGVKTLNTYGNSAALEKLELNKCQNKSENVSEPKIVSDKMFRCEPCMKTFSSYETLKEHIIRKHTSSGSFTCKICHQRLSTQTSLNRHMNLHGTTFTCGECGKVLGTKAFLNAHLERHKPEEERNYKFTCSFCGKKFLSKQNYKDHLNKHTGNKPYSCDICDKKFGFRSMLSRHKTSVHSSDRPFICGYCMEDFKTLESLKRHTIVPCTPPASH